jgi:hypothetical protein
VLDPIDQVAAINEELICLPPELHAINSTTPTKQNHITFQNQQ